LSDENPVGQLAALAGSDPAQAARLIGNLPVGDPQRDFTLQVVQTAFDTNPAVAAELIGHLTAPLDSQMASALASLWGTQDIASAVAWATNLPPGPVQTQALFSLLADWGSADPGGAAEFIVRPVENEFPLDARNAHDASESESETSSRIRTQMMEIIGARWAATNSSAAIAWADQLPLGNSRDSFLAGISSTIGEMAPGNAAELVASMSPGEKQEEAALTVLLEWGRKDLQAAGEWLGLFSAGDFRHRALLNLTSTALYEDPAATQTLLLSWPEPDERTQAIRHYFDETLDLDAAGGTNLLAGIEDPSLRSEETERLMQHWLARSSPPAAEPNVTTGH